MQYNKHIDDYIRRQGEYLQPLLTELRSLLHMCTPLLQEKIAYGIPFFYYLGRQVFYLCASRKNPGVVLLGFSHGSELSNEQGLLVGTGRVIRVVKIHYTERYNEQHIEEILHEALFLCEIKEENKKRKKARR